MKRLIHDVRTLATFIPGFVGSVCLLVGSPQVAAQAWRTTESDTYLSVFADGRPIFQYRHDGSPRKPFVKELFSPAGVQVLRDAPVDHYHHHGLMFAVAAEGVTFWVEDPEGGSQRSEGAPTVENGVLHQSLGWVKPGETQPILTEQRTISAHVQQDLPATLLTWRTRLQPGRGKQSVELTGSHYYGLGLRFPQSMDRVGRFVNSTGQAGEVVRGEERLVQSAWIAYLCPSTRQPVTVAVFDHPENRRHPATMFNMPTSFAYISATLNLWKQPLLLQEGETLDLRYGIAVWDGETPSEAIEALYRRWVKAAKP